MNEILTFVGYLFFACSLLILGWAAFEFLLGVIFKDGY